MPAEHLKFYVGVDFGTTASALSFVLSDKNELRDIDIVNQYPDESEIVSKVPSRIAFASENAGLEADESEWGFSVLGTRAQYTWFKLLLDRKVELSEFDDRSLHDLIGNGMCRTPADMSAQDVCAAYLRCLYGYLIHYLEKKFEEEVVKNTPIEFWVTVPAIWSDKAKSATLAAASTAGFGLRPLDKVCLITEPEAAALAALKPHVGPDVLDPVHPGESILVCDCGGGTVDITTYTILEVTPEFKFQELCLGMGGKCGATAIDRNFNLWMIKTFGNAYKKLPLERRAPGSRFMRSFESAKKNFGSQLYGDHQGKTIQIDLFMKLETPEAYAETSDIYDEDDGTLTLSPAQMQEFFDPVVSDVLLLVESQVELAQKDHKTRIDRIILVGGFGDSEYLNARMKSWCAENRDIKLTCPPHCQAAVVKGAALRGLQRIVPEQRRARRHYGYSCGMTFREGIDNEANAYYDAWDGRKRCGSRMDWVVLRGAPIDEFTNTSYTIQHTIENFNPKDAGTHLSLFCCDREVPPDYKTHYSVEKVGVVYITFNKEDIINADQRWNPTIGRHVKKLNFDVHVDLNAEQGVLIMSTVVDGRKSGKAEIMFD